MSGLILLSMGLTALVGALCTLLYSRTQKLTYFALEQKEQMARLEVQLHDMIDLQKNSRKRIEELATDVLHREIYHGTGGRHQLAIRDAKEGRSMSELVRKHGLSSDEAALIIALHAIPVGSNACDIHQISELAVEVSSNTGR